MKLLVLAATSLFFFFSALLLRPAPPEEKWAALYNKVVDTTVSVYVTGEREGSKGTIVGSGVFVTSNNHVLTAAHLFWPLMVSGVLVCNSGGSCVDGTLLYKEDKLDLAVVQVEFSTPTAYARVADPRRLRVGQEVLAIGNPKGLEFSASHGIISALYRDIGGAYNMNQSDAMINPGNSGGPLFNMKGEIVGINSRILPASPTIPVNSGLGFSVQSGQLIEFLTRFKGLGENLP